jgi:hypothetical protein
MKHKYQKGGKVKISGKWRKLYETYNPTFAVWKVEGMEAPLATLDLDEIVAAYEPPQPEAYEWITSDQLFAYCKNALNWDQNADSINAFLSKVYGDPTVRTYSGEEPEEFGLMPKSLILVWAGFMWMSLPYADLGHGDKWRKQPPAPQSN